MAFAPSSTIYFCNVPFDSTYRNQIYFATKLAQQDYFIARRVNTASEYLTVRKMKPEGGVRSSVKVGFNIDEMSKCNYMMYQNANHGTKWFYAFITNLIYINEQTTEVEFETDVYQTWLFDVTIQDSFVVREHSKTDNEGDNIVPEPFNFDDYEYHFMSTPSTLGSWGYLIVASESVLSATGRGYLMSGIYQGLYFYYGKTRGQVNEILDALEEAGSDCVVSVTLIPTFCLKESTIGATVDGYGQVFTSEEPVIESYELDMSAFSYTFDGYKPKNNKLLTSPFMKLVISNHSGEESEYNLEDFSNQSLITFLIEGDISPTPSIFMYPKNYKGLANAVDFGISLGSFPQCSFNNDVYKLWLNKNLKSSAINAIASGASGAVMGMVTGGPPLGIAAGVTNLAGSVASTLAEGMRMSKEANLAHLGNASNNLLTACGHNRFDFYVRSIKRTFAEQIDDYFTMFGYATRKVKKPNLSSRPYFNYVQTQGINIIGGIPTDDMERLKQVYDNGVTLWKPSATVGDYSVDNSPT